MSSGLEKVLDGHVRLSDGLGKVSDCLRNVSDSFGKVSDGLRKLWLCSLNRPLGRFSLSRSS